MKSRMQAAARAALLCGSLASPLAAASEVAVNGYLGYAAADANIDIECDTRACAGVLDSTLYYGLSLGFQEGNLGGQVIVSQDVNEDPRVSLAQISLSGLWRDYVFTGRAGRVIVPLGLYGTHRITPNTRPGLVLPQSFLLNNFYDLLTLSEEGVAGDIRHENGFSLKAAVYQPSDEVVESIVIVPPASPLQPATAGLLGGLLQLLLGSPDPETPETPETPATGGTTTVRRDARTDRGYYLGASYEQESWRADAGWTRIQLGNDDLDAYNLGLEYTWESWQPSAELLRLETNNGSPLNGASLNLVYSAERWQLFGSAVRFEADGRRADEDILGGAYYLDAWSARLTHHHIRGNSLNDNLPDDGVRSTILSVAYSFSF